MVNLGYKALPFAPNPPMFVERTTGLIVDSTAGSTAIKTVDASAYVHPLSFAARLRIRVKWGAVGGWVAVFPGYQASTTGTGVDYVENTAQGVNIVVSGECMTFLDDQGQWKWQPATTAITLVRISLSAYWRFTY